jgi:hypothetical protein
VYKRKKKKKGLYTKIEKKMKTKQKLKTKGLYIKTKKVIKRKKKKTNKRRVKSTYPLKLLLN